MMYRMFGRSSARAAAAKEQKAAKEAKRRNERRAARLRCANMGFVSCVWRGLLDDTEQATTAAQHNPAIDGGQSTTLAIGGRSLGVAIAPWIGLAIWAACATIMFAGSLYVQQGSLSDWRLVFIAGGSIS